jgi:sec-independent protein translocase protein TatC
MAEEPEEIEEQEGLQMSFLDHLDELRKRLIQSVIAIAIAFAVGFGFSKQIYDFLAVPVKTEARKARLSREAKLIGPDTREALTKNLKEGDVLQYTFTLDSVIEASKSPDKTETIKVPMGTTIPAKIIKKDGSLTAVLAQNWILGKTVIPQDRELLEVLGEAAPLPGFDVRDDLVITKVGGAFTLYMTVALYTAIALAIPFLLYQLWAFVAPGLYQHEKKYVIPVLTMGTLLFIIGATFAYKIAFPAACNFLLGWQEGFQTLLNAEDYLDLILIMMLGLGLVFQIPTLAFILGRIGLVTPRLLLRWWRHAVVIIVIIAAIITPTPDAQTLLIFAVPMWLLYFMSVGIVWLFGKPRKNDDEVGELATNE